MLCVKYSIVEIGPVILLTKFNEKMKQEAHGPHRSPEKTVQINKHI